MPVLRVGVDDTDSVKGMCTTYVGAVLERKLLSMGCRKAELSRLIRLNPNCPFKTRGNAAVSLHLEVPEEMVEQVVKTVVKTVEELYEKGYENTQPGVVFYEGVDVPEEWKRFAFRAVREIVSLDDALTLAEKHGARVFMFNGGRGVIGALAAIALPLTNPTYEAIAYRVRDNWGTVRRIDVNSVLELVRTGLSFDTYDPASREIRITPHTPCPVLAGVRSASAENAVKALGIVKFHEEIELTTVYATNQATDMHYVESKISQLRPFTNAVIAGTVASNPSTTQGGHVFFKLSDGRDTVTCAVYAPTGGLRKVASALMPGDELTVMGAVKQKPQGLTVNVEKIEVKRLVEHFVLRPPLCPGCGRRTESAGREQGYRCRRCGVKLPSEAVEKTSVPRKISPGIYEAAISARRHLTKPVGLTYLGVVNSQ
ncbi:MAG: tRNA(Ile)(2)-agmatinylcytidine synthase [Candidatus Caldarchaeum sp.]|nr:tRNA(Ile)(2)-agmatinylcytidine synthase [Candidatus Caldarchaeum sp.]